MITFLGCGPSSGVPSPFRGWGTCDPLNPKNRRLRSSLALGDVAEPWLIDASPDLRYQCLHHGITQVKGIGLTHAHFDHTQGLNEFARHKPLPVWGDQVTLNEIAQRFSYLWAGKPLAPFQLIPLQPYAPFRFAGVDVIPLPQNHGSCHSMGFLFPKFAYTTDVKELSEDVLERLVGIPLWIIGCLAWTGSSAGHALWPQVDRWRQQVKPQRMILTHMGPDMDYATLQANLPLGVQAAYDGLQLQGYL